MKLKIMELKCGIAINPETSIESIKEYLPYIHQVLVMTVNPGKGGQELIVNTLNKIKELKQYLDENDLNHIDIEADGGINASNAQSVRETGCDILVSGSYVISSEIFSEAVQELRGD